VNAEESLAHRACEAAAREITTALELAPEDADLVALKEHIDGVWTRQQQLAAAGGTKRSYLNRLFQK
jgi:hypothetical protein